MRNSHRLSALFCALALSPTPSQSATFGLTFWENDPANQSFRSVTVNNITAQGRRVWGPPQYTGTITINDNALGSPNAFIPLASNAIEGLDVTIGDVRYNLPGDGVRTSDRPIDDQIGIRLDQQGRPQRTDIPSAGVSNAGAIEDTASGLFNPPRLTLWDTDLDFASANYLVRQPDGFVSTSVGLAETWGLLSIDDNGLETVTALGEELLIGPAARYDVVRSGTDIQTGFFVIDRIPGAAMANPPEVIEDDGEQVIELPPEMIDPTPPIPSGDDNGLPVEIVAPIESPFDPSVPDMPPAMPTMPPSAGPGPAVAPIPLPAPAFMLIAGLAGLFGLRLRKTA